MVEHTLLELVDIILGYNIIGGVPWTTSLICSLSTIVLARLDVNCIKSFSDDVKIYVIVNTIKDSSGLLHSALQCYIVLLVHCVFGIKCGGLTFLH